MSQCPQSGLARNATGPNMVYSLSKRSLGPVYRIDHLPFLFDLRIALQCPIFRAFTKYSAPPPPHPPPPRT